MGHSLLLGQSSFRLPTSLEAFSLNYYASAEAQPAELRDAGELGAWLQQARRQRSTEWDWRVVASALKLADIGQARTLVSLLAGAATAAMQQLQEDPGGLSGGRGREAEAAGRAEGAGGHGGDTRPP